MINSRRLTTLTVLCSMVISGLCFTARSAEITTPEKFLGFKVGAEYKLATYEQVVGYLENLASESPRIKVFDMGSTSMGRRQKYAVISSDENIKNLDHFKEIAKKLSLARGVSEADARKLAKEGKAVAWIDGGMHATEVVGSHQQIQLAYDLVTREDERTRLIRDNVITMLVWTNPDGMTMVADWYKKNLGTSYEWSQLPWLWQKYAGHDNNRESHMANLSETQNTHRLLYHEWFPVVYYCQHQAAPYPTRIQISPPGDPANPNVHPLVRWWENIIGPTAGRALEELGLTGAITGTMLDFYYAGTVNAIAEQHNIAGLLTETASGIGAPLGQFSFATSHNDLQARFPDEYKDLVPGQNYPSPWKGGWWRFSDQIQYNLVVSNALLELVAQQKSNFLFDQWRMATDIIERFKKEPPYGWIISATQRDPNTTALLLDRFLLEGLEIYQADEAFTHEGVSYPKGSYVIPTSQPYGLWAKSVLERQDFPDLRKYPYIWQMRSRPEEFRDDKGEELLPPLVPFENTGWTMPLLMGIDSQMMSTPLKVNMHQINVVQALAASVDGSGPQIAFSHSDNNSFKAVNRIQKAGGKVSLALAEFTLGGAEYPPGTFIVDAASLPPAALKEIASATHVPMASGQVAVGSSLLPKPRVGIYQSWDANMDAGWMTYLFDQYEFPYVELHDADIRAGKLRDRLDVIILPDQRPDSIVNGLAKGTMPEEYVGGMMQVGVENLVAFVNQGGTLICNKSSLDLAIGLFHLPVKNVLRGIPAKDFTVAGSILRIDFDTSHPLAFGMEEKGFGYVTGVPNTAAGLSAAGHAFEITSDRPAAEKKDSTPTVRIVARFPDEPLLASGFMIGEKYLRGEAVVLEASVGLGRVVLFGFNVVNRAQSYATHKLLYNAIFCGAGPQWP